MVPRPSEVLPSPSESRKTTAVDSQKDLLHSEGETETNLLFTEEKQPTQSPNPIQRGKQQALPLETVPNQKRDQTFGEESLLET